MEKCSLFLLFCKRNGDRSMYAVGMYAVDVWDGVRHSDGLFETLLVTRPAQRTPRDTAPAAKRSSIASGNDGSALNDQRR